MLAIKWSDTNFSITPPIGLWPNGHLRSLKGTWWERLGIQTPTSLFHKHQKITLEKHQHDAIKVLYHQEMPTIFQINAC
uniref:Uncharacterized protein n=1 Tax=Rhizophora mucronata TaxID=61149 RepID=A0A2P2NQE6_RHIMU